MSLMNSLDMVVVDAQLLKNCLTAFNEIPNRHVGNGVKTYDLAAQLSQVIRECEKQGFNEVLQRFIDQQANELDQNTDSNHWRLDPSLKKLVELTQQAVRLLKQEDRFNFNMDMLNRPDLIVPV